MKIKYSVDATKHLANQLKALSQASFDDVVTKQMGHVEYGHRTKGGGFVPGQHFLKDNVDMQAPIYKEDLIDAIRKIAKG